MKPNKDIGVKLVVFIKSINSREKCISVNIYLFEVNERDTRKKV